MGAERGAAAVCAGRRQQSAGGRCGIRWAGAAGGLARHCSETLDGQLDPERDLSRCRGRGLGRVCGAHRRGRTARAWSAWRGFRERWAERRCRMWARMGRKWPRSSSECGCSICRSELSRNSRRRSAGLLIGAAGSTRRIAERYHCDAGGLSAHARRRADLALCRTCKGRFRHGQMARSRAWLMWRQRCGRIRQAKGMLLVEGDPDCRSAGSFFKNPVVSEEQSGRLRR